MKEDLSKMSTIEAYNLGLIKGQDYMFRKALNWLARQPKEKRNLDAFVSAMEDSDEFCPD